MDLTKRQKMMLSVLGLAVGAFVIDAALPGPSSASAASMPEADAPPGVAPVAGTAPASAATPVATSTTTVGTDARHEALMRVVQRLRSVEPGEDAEADALSDPFAGNQLATTAQFDEEPLQLPQVQEVPSPIALERQPATPTTPSLPTISISSIIKSPDGPLAHLNGQLRREGDRIGEWTITRIAERSIQLTIGTHEVWVPMDP